MDIIEVKYTSFAIAPSGIKLGKIYSFGKDKNGYYVGDVYCNKYMDVADIKAMFTPVNGKWENEVKTNRNTEKQ